MKMLWTAAALLLLAGCNSSQSQTLIVGDSISLGYTPYVETRDADVAHNGACPYYIDADTGPTNAGNSKRAASCMDIWLSQGNYRIVHFNTGLHDVRDCGNGPAVALSDYLMNLQSIIDAIRAHGAVPIFATTTPVEHAMACHSDLTIQEYNAAAVEMMHSQGIQVDDLYAYMAPYQTQYHGDEGIHFTQQGYEFLAARVISALSATASN